MNRLQLCQRAGREAGIAGTGPAATVGALTGELRRIVDWVDAAYEEIQAGHDHWSFLWERTTITVPGGSSDVANTVPASRYVHDSARVSSTQALVYLPWRDFAELFPAPAAGTPAYWTIRPDLKVAVSAIPAADFTFTVERYKLPQVMAADTDQPVLPAHHHLTIVWRAAMLYQAFDEAGVSFRLAKANYEACMAKLLAECTPAVRFGGALC